MYGVRRVFQRFFGKMQRKIIRHFTLSGSRPYLYTVIILPYSTFYYSNM